MYNVSYMESFLTLNIKSTTGWHVTQRLRCSCFWHKNLGIWIQLAFLLKGKRKIDYYSYTESDQHQFSLNKINTQSGGEKMRISKSSKERKCQIKFSQLILQGNVWRSEGRICMQMLRLKPLFQGETTGTFQKLELTSQTIARHVILTTKNAFSKRFCWKSLSFVPTI